MKKRGFFAFFIWLTIGILLTIGGCQLVKTHSNTLTVSAAISLTDALENIKSLYRQSYPNITITYNFGASGSLQQQIEQGAPADIFISAASKQMDALQQKSLLITETRTNLLANTLVLITPKNNSIILSFQNLINPKVNKIAIGEPKSVPAGQYSQELLTNLKIFDKIKPKIVYSNNVRQVLTYVETGNVDAGIVYITDAKQSKRVQVVATAAANLHSPIVYPVAVLKRSKDPAIARKFVQFLSSDRARAVFEKYGFKMASK